MAFVEDRQLLELSRSPKRSLFPVLNRAESMSPLIVLLALIPPLYVLAHRTLTPLDAMWGLKAIAVTTSDSPEVWIDPDMARGTKEMPLEWQPPLSTWLIAGMMSLTGTERPLALVLCSFLATAGLVVSVFGLADRWRGPQFAWWTTCLVAIHGPILQGAQTPAPVSLTLAFAVATCWGFVVHRQDARRLFSLPLAWGGIAWGLCLLAGGPVALVIVAILLLYVASLSQESIASKKANGGKSRRVWKGRPALQSLGVLLLIGLIVGGWWEIWMFFRHGFEFLQSWFAGASVLPDTTDAHISFGRQLLRDVSQMGGALVGLSVLGLGVGLRMLRQPTGNFERSSLMLILGWAGCAAIVWLSLRASSHGPNAFTIVWRGFCLFPATVLAALAIEQIGERRIGYFGVLLGVFLTLAVLLMVPVEVGFGLIDSGRPLWPSILPVLDGFSNSDASRFFVWFWRLLFLLALGLTTYWGAWRLLKGNDFRQRIFLGIVLGFFVVAHGLVGLLGVRQATLNDRALAALRSEMIQEPGVVRWTIVSPRRSPLVLRFVIASVWPTVESLEVDSWWDPQITQDLVEGDVPNGVHIIIDYNDRDIRTPILRLTDNDENSHFVEFTPVGTPQILWNHRLRMYELSDRMIGR